MQDKYLCALYKCRNVYDIIALSRYEIEQNGGINNVGKNSSKHRKDIINLKIERILQEYQKNESEGYTIAFSTVILAKLEQLCINDELCVYTHFSIIRHFSNCFAPQKLIRNNTHGSYGYEIALNENHDTTGVLVFSKSRHKLIKKLSNSIGMGQIRGGLRNFLEDEDDMIKNDNVIIRTKNEIDNAQIKFIKVPSVANYVQMVEECRLDIAIIPFISCGINHILEYEEDDEYFWFPKATEYATSDEYIERYFSTLHKALMSSANIILFPEMILNENILNVMKDRIRSFRVREQKIIVCGTIAVNGNNKCIVCDNKGNIIFEQHKIFPYEMTEKKEKLVRPDSFELCVLDIEHMGRVMMCICKDVNHRKIQETAHMLEIDFLFVIAYSKSGDINYNAKSLTEKVNCISVLCNSCSAVNDGNGTVEEFVNSTNTGVNVGYINTPGKKGNSLRVSMNYLCKTDSHCCECHEWCKMYLSHIYFGESVESVDNIRSCKLITERV